MTALTPTNPPPSTDDDGMSSTSSQAISTYLKWTDASGWKDRDGCNPPSPLLVYKMQKFAGRWEETPEGRHQLLRKPLNELEQLNSAIPVSQWKLDQKGQPEAPWKVFAGIYSIDPATGRGFKYEHSTWGAKRMFDELQEQVSNTRILRGVMCLPLVEPSEKPWKIEGIGMRKRPTLIVLHYKTPPRSDGEPVPAPLPAPQLSGPATVEPPASADHNPTPHNPAPAQAQPAGSNPQPAKQKPAVNVAAETLDAMGDVKPVTMSEAMNDEIVVAGPTTANDDDTSW